MGALHVGHRSLFDRARFESDTVVTSIFVNPLQFDDANDLAQYPRPVEADLEICGRGGVDVVFLPSIDEMYPRPIRTTVAVADVTEHLEGAHRPGHFDGVATVVAKLFAGIQPDRAYFGRKDAQQVAVVTTMAGDLSLPVEVVPCSTVRDPDGMALSSRNVFLSTDERERARGLSRGLMAAADAVVTGVLERDSLVSIARSEMAGVDEVEYVELASQADAQPLEAVDRPAFLAVAAQVGSTRLIDNVAFDLVDGHVVADRGRIA
jgi:pantoate--beta-alanine ligase